MTSYILLALLIAILLIGIVRATRQPKPHHKKKYHYQESQLQSPVPEPEPEPPASVVVEREVPQVIEVAPKPDIPPVKVKQREDRLITITLRAAKDRPYRGYELLQALLTSGLRFNRTGVFHRYQKLINRDEVLFTLISAVAPGTFELPKMGTFTSPALTLFMQTGQLRDPLQTYNMMLATAEELVDVLGGQVLDEKREPLTPEKIADWQAMLDETDTAVVS